MAAVTICSDFGDQKNNVCHCFQYFPTYLPWSDGTGCHNLHFWMLNYKPTFSLSSFIFIKRLLSFSSHSAIRVVSSACLRLLLFLLAILIPAYASSSLAFCMMYSAGWQYTALTYSFSYLEPVCCSMSSSNCCFLTCIQISQNAGQVVWYSHLLKNFPQFVVIHTVKGFGIAIQLDTELGHHHHRGSLL